MVEQPSVVMLARTTRRLLIGRLCTSLVHVDQSHGHGKSWKTMENEKIKSRPGKVMENENVAKSHGKIMEFCIFISVYPITFEKMVLITYNFDTQ